MTNLPFHHFTIQFSPPEVINLERIDHWLTSVLLIEDLPPIRKSHHQSNSNSSSNSDFLLRVLLLQRAMMEWSNIPVFSIGKILTVEQDPTNKASLLARILLFHVEQIPKNFYKNSLSLTVNLLLWLEKKPISLNEKSHLYSFIENKIISPLRKNIATGKSTIPVLRTAHQLDIPTIHLGGGIYQLGWGCKLRRLDRSTTDMDSAIGAKFANNKALAAALLSSSGLPSPRQVVVSRPTGLASAAKNLGWPVVVKPVDRDGGLGVTVGVINDTQLLSAFNIAKQSSRVGQVVIEEEVSGVCHRIFIAKGQMLYAVKRHPKSVKGDGEKTVSELIIEANNIENQKPPWLRSEVYPDDAEAIEAMGCAGYFLSSIPPITEWVPLRKIESTAAGGRDEEVTYSIHKANVDIAVRAADLFGLDVAGVDIISTDITQPWHLNKAVINEVNFAPLLGGGDISRSHLPTYLKNLFSDDGRIPIVVVIGGASAFDAARIQQQILLKSEYNCFLTSHNMSLDTEGNEIFFSVKSLYTRTKALLMNKNVESLILLVQTDEFLYTGIPVDKIKNIIITNDLPITVQREGGEISTAQMENLVQLFTLIPPPAIPSTRSGS